MFNFKKLTLNDKTSIEKFNSRFEPYSDFNFASLWCYNIKDNVEFSLSEDLLVIKLPDYVTGEFIYSFLSNSETKQTVHNLLNTINSEGAPKKLSLVPEISITEEIKTDPTLLIEPDRDGYDYILSVPDVADLSKPEYKFKRRHINRFLRAYPNTEIKVTNFSNKNETDQIMSIFNQWAHSKDKDTSNEWIALSRLVDYKEKLNLENLGIWEGDKLIGFNLFENLGEYAVGSFMKGNPSYENIYDMLYYQVAVHLNKQNCKFLNYEQDLGIIPMREAKLHWHPISFLKKYTISHI